MKRGDGTEHNGNLQQGLTQIVAAGPGLGESHRVLELAGALLRFAKIDLPLLKVSFVLADLGRNRRGVRGGLQAKKVYCCSGVIGTDLLGLVLVPLIGGAGLFKHCLSVGAMAEDRDHGNEYGKNGDGERDSGRGFALLASFLQLIGELLDLGRFHGEDSNLQKRGRACRWDAPVTEHLAIISASQFPYLTGV